MCRLVCQTLGLCALILCCLTASAAQSDVPSFIKPEHRRAVRGLLKMRPYLRVATPEDAENKERLGLVSDNNSGVGHAPYYAIGDFNGDGRRDFAVAFVNTRRPKNFAVAIFNGPFGRRRQSAPAFYDERRFGTDDFLLTYQDEDAGRDGLQMGIPGGDMTPMIKPRRGGRGYYFTTEMTQ